MDTQREPTLIGTIVRASSIWLTCLFGFYLFLPTILGSVQYSTNPISISIYYLVWIALTIFEFWPLYRDWKVFEASRYIYWFLGLGSLAIAFYFTYILPHFDPIHWSKLWQQPSEILFATPDYFLPKSFDILLQQLLFSALVISFNKSKFSFRTICTWCAGAFGGAHLLLVLGDNTPAYVAAFTISALVASFVFPYLILKVRNGLIYSYFLHWSFYAIVIIVLRAILG